MSNIALRVLTAAIAIPIVLLLDREGGIAFGVAVALAAAIGAGELCRMMRSAGYEPISPLAIAASALVAFLPLVAGIHTKDAWVGILFFALVLGAFLDLLRFGSGRHTLSWLLTLIPIVYVGLLLGHLGLLRGAGDGAWWVFLVLVITWAYDTGAFVAGRAFGSRPFMQRVSSRKTVEGVVGGLGLSIAAGLLAVPTVGLAVWQAAIFGLFLGAVAQTGDLVESMAKRQSGLKDSGAIIPGHGGLLDRIDSLLFTGAVAYYFAALFGHVS